MSRPQNYPKGGTKAMRSASYLLILGFVMTSFKRQQNGRLIDIIQWVGLILLIAFTHNHFGPGAHTPIMPAIGVFGAAVFLLLGPIPLKLKQ
jgi:hypothetical protein